MYIHSSMKQSDFFNDTSIYHDGYMNPNIDCRATQVLRRCALLLAKNNKMPLIGFKSKKITSIVKANQ